MTQKHHLNKKPKWSSASFPSCLWMQVLWSECGVLVSAFETIYCQGIARCSVHTQKGNNQKMPLCTWQRTKMCECVALSSHTHQSHSQFYTGPDWRRVFCFWKDPNSPGNWTHSQLFLQLAGIWGVFSLARDQTISWFQSFLGLVSIAMTSSQGHLVPGQQHPHVVQDATWCWPNYCSVLMREVESSASCAAQPVPMFGSDTICRNNMCRQWACNSSESWWQNLQLLLSLSHCLHTHTHTTLSLSPLSLSLALSLLSLFSRRFSFQWMYGFQGTQPQRHWRENFSNGGLSS